MAILVALLAPNVLKYIEKSKFGKDINSLDSVRLGVEAELMDEELSNYTTNSKWVALKKIKGATTGMEKSLSDRLFGDAQVLSVDFEDGNPFTSKTAAAAEIYIYVDGNGGIAVAGVASGAIVSYNGEDLVVSSKLDTIPAFSTDAGGDESEEAGE